MADSFKSFMKNVEKQQKEQKVIDQLKNQIKILERRRDGYAEEAKKYLKQGKKEMYAAQVAAMKYAIYNINLTESMLANYTFAKEMSDMQNISKAFTKSIKTVLKDVVKVADSINVAGNEKLFQKALAKSNKTSLELRDCLKNNNLSFADSVSSVSDVSDDEIYKILGSDIQREEEEMDDELSSLESEFVKPESQKEEEQKVAVGPAPGPVPAPAPAPVVPEKPVEPAPEEPKEEPVQEDAGTQNMFEYHGKDYIFPPLSLLKTFDGQEQIRAENTAEIESISNAIVNKLHSFGVDIELDGFIVGASYSRLEYRLVSNSPLSQIAKHADDISMVIRRKIRLLLPIEGKDLIGVEVQNSKRETLGLKEMLADERGQSKKINLGIGYTIDNEPIYKNFDNLPHLLVGGTTGSGKSVFLSSVIMSMLFKHHPKDVRLVLIDFKRVEMNVYNYIPHLVGERTIDEFEDSVTMLSQLCDEMERRYALLAENRSRNVNEYNEKVDESKKLPTIIVIIDEYADMTSNKDYKDAAGYIQRLVQKARAANIHLIIATQRPSVKVIDGVIKANLPSRIAFAVANHNDSMSVLDQSGAQSLIGAGDMLFQNGGTTIRLQAPFVSTDEINEVVDFVIKENS